MRFLIHRTSHFYHWTPDAPPCANTTWEAIPDSIRDFAYKQNGWFIEINTLEELMALVRDERLVVNEDVIEIYDSYRE